MTRNCPQPDNIGLAIGVEGLYICQHRAASRRERLLEKKTIRKLDWELVYSMKSKMCVSQEKGWTTKKDNNFW